MLIVLRLVTNWKLSIKVDLSRYLKMASTCLQPVKMLLKLYPASQGEWNILWKR